jgi:aldehyde dehydrogenase (NAD+)
MAAPQPEKTELLLAPGKTFIQHEPLGVAAVFGAWNYPFILIFKPMIQAITTGNCCLIKPSELTPTCSAVVKKFVH